MKLLLILAIVLFPSCNGFRLNKYEKLVYTSIYTMVKARDATGKTLNNIAKAKNKECAEKHGVKTEGYKICIKPIYDTLVKWRDEIRPAVTSAIMAAKLSADIAVKAGDKSLDWKALLAPAGCQIMGILKQWGHFFPDKGREILTLVSVFTGGVCHGY